MLTLLAGPADHCGVRGRGARVLYNHNETRLLKLRARELSLVLSTAVPTLQTPLASAAELANATGGSAHEVPRLHDAAGRERAGRFTSASLWPAGGSPPEPTVVVGQPPALARGRRKPEAVRPAEQSGQLVLTEPAPRDRFRGSDTPSRYRARTAGYIVYAENPLPASRHSQLAESTGFGDLNYALYLGRSRSAENRLVTT